MPHFWELLGFYILAPSVAVTAGYAAARRLTGVPRWWSRIFVGQAIALALLALAWLAWVVLAGLGHGNGPPAYHARMVQERNMALALISIKVSERAQRTPWAGDSVVDRMTRTLDVLDKHLRGEETPPEFDLPPMPSWLRLAWSDLLRAFTAGALACLCLILAGRTRRAHLSEETSQPRSPS